MNKTNTLNKTNLSVKMNPFDTINPINNNYFRLKEIINKINDKNELIKINEIIDQRLQELNDK
tara:strand:+ start:701 stop:889 length:189 start_codon:yes stop_codon:yes gene_type:complete